MENEKKVRRASASSRHETKVDDPIKSAHTIGGAVVFFERWRTDMTNIPP